MVTAQRVRCVEYKRRAWKYETARSMIYRVTMMVVQDLLLMRDERVLLLLLK